MMPDDATWCKMMQHDARWCKMMQDDARWCKMMQDDARWCKMIQDDARWCKMMQDDARWCKMIQDDARWCKMMQDDARWCNMMQDDARWCKMMQDDDTMILYNRAKNHTSERTIVPWTVIFELRLSLGCPEKTFFLNWALFCKPLIWPNGVSFFHMPICPYEKKIWPSIVGKTWDLGILDPMIFSGKIRKNTKS